MAISFFNTLTAKRDSFTPLDPQRVTVYVCGPTVYNYVHIGNARPLVIFDALFRLLKLSYPDVCYVRNITDIDDKIINTAKENGQSIAEVSEYYSDAFHTDIKPLNLLQPSCEPRATEYILPMIEMVEQLLHNDCAYIAEGHVLFNVSHSADYGQLSKRNLDEMIAGARVEVAPYKQSPADFILWKPSAPDQPGWDSPWGRGRPGWHLECSVMAKAHLGDVIDIHGGGQDLIFPHHENEIAQSRCAHNTSAFARYWIHNGYITVDGKKMSKSLNNFFTLREVLENWHGEVVRYALLNTHYRKPLDWKAETLEQAKLSLDRLYRILEKHPQANDREVRPELVPPAVIEAMQNDLNTPLAIAELHKLSSFSADADNMIDAARFLGLLQCQPDAWFKWQAGTRSADTISDAEIEALISERKQARLAQDYAKSDAIRDRLAAAGVILEDRDGQTFWRKQ